MPLAAAPKKMGFRGPYTYEQALAVPNFARFFPRLLEHLRTGKIFVDQGTAYAGIASDGITVWLGGSNQEAIIEKYLTSNPTPKDW